MSRQTDKERFMMSQGSVASRITADDLAKVAAMAWLQAIAQASPK
jgi:hypothetical protein